MSTSGSFRIVGILDGLLLPPQLWRLRGRSDDLRGFESLLVLLMIAELLRTTIAIASSTVRVFKVTIASAIPDYIKT